jgi:hypothetical protein
MPPNVQRRRKIALAITIITVAAAVVIWFYISRPQTQAINFEQAAPASLAEAVPYQDNSVVVATSSGFVTVRPSDGASHPLGNPVANLGLTAIDSLSVSADRSNLLFHDSLAPEGSNLYAILKTEGLDTATDHWWVYNVDRQVFYPLPGAVLLAKFKENAVLGLTVSASGEVIDTYSPDGTQTASLAIPSCTDFFAVPGGYLLETIANNVLFTSDGVVSKTVAHDATVTGVTADQSYALLSQSANHQTNLARLDLKTYRLSTVASGVASQQAWLPSPGVVLFGRLSGSSQPTGLASYNAATGQLVEWVFPPDKLSFGGAQPLTLLSPATALLLLTPQHKYVIVSNQSISSSLTSL